MILGVDTPVPFSGSGVVMRCFFHSYVSNGADDIR